MTDIEGARLEAQEITRVLPATEVLAYKIVYPFKVAFAGAFLIFGSWVGTKLGIASLAKDLILWIVAIGIAVLPLNTQGLIWLFRSWIVVFGRSRAFSPTFEGANGARVQ